jgi:hypothetical protein
MGLRFRKRITIFPGLTVNVSKSGIGVSAGPRGAKIGVGPRGIHRSVGLPGTGIHYREDTSWGALRNQGGRNRTDTGGSGRPRGGGASGTDGARAAGGVGRVTLQVNDDGRVDLLGEGGAPLSAHAARTFRAANAAEIAAFMEEVAAHWNQGIDEILRIHLSTPAPDAPLPFEARTSEHTRPPPFVPKPVGLMGGIWPPRRRTIEAENREEHRRWREADEAWQRADDAFQQAEALRRADHEVGRFSDREVMERVLAERLGGLPFPRRTELSFQVRDEGREVVLDVDLPEIAEMPTAEASPAARGLRFNLRKKSDTEIRRDYMQHVHAVLFRIVGEAFHALPRVQRVVASGFTQRPDPATGQIDDTYLVSVRVEREAWAALNFENLAAIDLVTCFEGFDLRRSMTRTGIFTPIEPFVQGDPP